MAFNRKLMDRTLLLYIGRHPYELLSNQLDIWDGQTNVHEWLKGDREVVALRLWAPDSAFELAVHQVDNYGSRSLEMGLP